MAKPLTVTVTAPNQSYAGYPTQITINVSPDPGTPTPGLEPRIDIVWGDGQSTTHYELSSPPYTHSHIYNVAGTYSITVTFLNRETGQSGTGQDNVQVAAPLTVSFVANKTSVNTDEPVTFTITLSNGYPPYDWTVDFNGDNIIDAGGQYTPGTFTQQYTYLQQGVFTATLTVTDQLGTEQQLTAKLNVGLTEPNLLYILLVALGLGATAYFLTR